jgi:hypothetical protein
MPDAELVDTVSAALEQSERVDEHPILVTPPRTASHSRAPMPQMQTPYARREER